MVALERKEGETIPLPDPHMHAWLLDEGWDRRLPADVTGWADFLSVGQGLVAYGDVRPLPGGTSTTRDPVVFDLATEESTRLSDAGRVLDLDAGEHLVVWVDARAYPDKPTEVYLYDHRVRQARAVTDDAHWQFEPRTDGRTVVWTDSRDGEYVPQSVRRDLNIYRYDAVSGEVSRVTADEHNQYLPDVHGDLVVYQDDRWVTPPGPEDASIDLEVYLTNWRTGLEVRLTESPREQYHPRIHGRTVLYKDTRFGTGTGYPGLTLLDLDCYEETYGVELDE